MLALCDIRFSVTSEFDSCLKAKTPFWHPRFCTFEIQASGHQKAAHPRGFCVNIFLYPQDGLLNNDVDLEHKFLEVHQGVKEVCKRYGVNFEPGRKRKVGKTKTATSKRPVPLNQTAVTAIELRQERNSRSEFASCER